ncbi:MAG TPA: diaminopimelate decarboxylase [Terriglobales bacterium]|nr:diaminopimelate decarboxylase [Terriglobales bacterium]
MNGRPKQLAALARRFGTPLYVYDFDLIRRNFEHYRRASGGVDHLICAAVKANGSLALLHRLAQWGSGFDVVSGGELERVLLAGGRADQTVFSGVGKTRDEIDTALRAGILLFNVESEAELDLLAQRAARLRRVARFGLRVNPDIAAVTHPHIATGLRQHKFGVTLALAQKLYLRPHSRWLEPAGISFHIGSQILDLAPFGQAAARVAQLAIRLAERGVALRYFDAGGGLGIAYRAGQHPPTIAAYVKALRSALPPGMRLLIEPGRSLVAAAGFLLTRVLYVKDSGRKRFVIVDAGSNDLLRPSLYDAYHDIQPLEPRRGPRRTVEIVGPICESGDVLGRERRLAPVAADDYLAIADAGAYGFSLSSNYNARPRAAEVALEGGRARLIRRRETSSDLAAAELAAQEL